MTQAVIHKEQREDSTNQRKLWSTKNRGKIQPLVMFWYGKTRRLNHLPKASYSRQFPWCPLGCNASEVHTSPQSKHGSHGHNQNHGKWSQVFLLAQQASRHWRLASHCAKCPSGKAAKEGISCSPLYPDLQVPGQPVLLTCLSLTG